MNVWALNEDIEWFKSIGGENSNCVIYLPITRHCTFELDEFMVIKSVNLIKFGGDELLLRIDNSKSKFFKFRDEAIAYLMKVTSIDVEDNMRQILKNIAL